MTWEFSARRHLMLGTLVLCTGLSLAVQACGEGVVSDSTPYWDRDGDTISTAVETESHNRSLYGFDTLVFNLNPSRSTGTRGNGSLVSGINLPDTGFGYLHYLSTDPKDYDDWGTLSLVNVIEQVGRWFRRLPCQTHCSLAEFLPRAQPGDMSLQPGGFWSDHDFHRNGTDVDVRYMRNDGTEAPLDLNDPSQRQYFDTTATLELLSCFLQTEKVVTIYYDSVLTGIINAQGDSTLVHDPTGKHRNHFHVAIVYPN